MILRDTDRGEGSLIRFSFQINDRFRSVQKDHIGQPRLCAPTLWESSSSPRAVLLMYAAAPPSPQLASAAAPTPPPPTSPPPPSPQEACIENSPFQVKIPDRVKGDSPSHLGSPEPEWLAAAEEQLSGEQAAGHALGALRRRRLSSALAEQRSPSACLQSAEKARAARRDSLIRAKGREAFKAAVAAAAPSPQKLETLEKETLE